MNMLMKRLTLAVISLVVGFVITFATVELIGTNLEEYGTTYTFFTVLSIALAVGVWLDKFMNTELLPK